MPAAWSTTPTICASPSARAPKPCATWASRMRSWCGTCNLMFVVRRIKVDYLRPARLDDSLIVVTEAAGGGRRLGWCCARTVPGRRASAPCWRCKLACVRRRTATSRRRLPPRLAIGQTSRDGCRHAGGRSVAGHARRTAVRKRRRDAGSADDMGMRGVQQVDRAVDAVTSGRGRAATCRSGACSSQADIVVKLVMLGLLARQRLGLGRGVREMDQPAQGQPRRRRVRGPVLVRRQPGRAVRPGRHQARATRWPRCSARRWANGAASVRVAGADISHTCVRDRVDRAIP